MADDDVHFELEVGGVAPIESPGDGEELLVGRVPGPSRLSPAMRAWRRVPPRWRIVGAGAFGLVAVLANNSGHDSRHGAAAETTAPTTTATDQAPVASNPTNNAINRLVARAESAGPVPSTIHGTRARLPRRAVRVGADPAGSVTSALVTQLPGFTLVDTSESRNPDGALCELDARLRNALGAVVVVSIVAPPQGAGPAFAVERGNDRTNVRDVATFSRGWRVEVGWVAQTGAEVDSAGLEAVARNGGLRW